MDGGTGPFKLCQAAREPLHLPTPPNTTTQGTSCEQETKSQDKRPVGAVVNRLMRFPYEADNRILHSSPFVPGWDNGARGAAPGGRHPPGPLSSQAWSPSAAAPPSGPAPSPVGEGTLNQRNSVSREGVLQAFLGIWRGVLGSLPPQPV